MRYIEIFKNKELLIALYFLYFIVGSFSIFSFNFYNDFRVLELLLLLFINLLFLFDRKLNFKKEDILFFLYLVLGYFFWDNSEFILFDLLVFYLLFKSLFFINYSEIITKFLLVSSIFIFLFFPSSIYNFMFKGVYDFWYPKPWNIRIYNSYFLVLLVFSVWYYLKESNFNYLIFIFLAFLSILLDGGRSATLSFTCLIIITCIFHHTARLKLMFTYCMSWITYLTVIFVANNSNLNLGSIVRETTSGRYELWINAFECWLKNPILGCGFYQIDKYPHLSAHPHNFFIQILSETGLVGFGFLIMIIYLFVKNTRWSWNKNYFFIGAIIAIVTDLIFSGSYLYPVTQISLLWLLVFLLKNDEFEHYSDFNSELKADNLNFIFGIFILGIILFYFIYLFIYTNSLHDSLPTSPPRFWEYGYKLF